MHNCKLKTYLYPTFMKKSVLFLVCILMSIASFSQSTGENIAIIPQPVSIIKGLGKFTLPKSIVIQAENTPDLSHTVAFLRERLSEIGLERLNV